MSIRSERVASLVKHEIGDMLTREYSDPSNGFITVTEVRMTPDLRVARIYLSIFGDAEVKARTMKMLDGERSHIRSFVGSRLQLKFVPTFEFYLDDTMDRVDRINTLIKKIHENDRNDASGS